MRECFCVGPQGGAPMCPCRMSVVQIKDGRYIETIDHGPVTRQPSGLKDSLIAWWRND
jgi:hypothetical protein